MKQIIKHIFHRMKEDSLARKMTEAQREKKYQSLHRIKNGLVFWVAGSEEGSWLKAVREKFSEVEVDKMCFVPPNYPGILTEDVIYIKTEDLAFGGKIMNDKLLQALEKSYDFFIDLTTESNVLIDYVLKNSRAKCKISMPKDNFEADIVLEGSKDPIVFINELSGMLSDLKEY